MGEIRTSTFCADVGVKRPLTFTVCLAQFQLSRVRVHCSLYAMDACNLTDACVVHAEPSLVRVSAMPKSMSRIQVLVTVRSCYDHRGDHDDTMNVGSGW